MIYQARPGNLEVKYEDNKNGFAVLTCWHITAEQQDDDPDDDNFVEHFDVYLHGEVEEEVIAGVRAHLNNPTAVVEIILPDCEPND